MLFTDADLSTPISEVENFSFGWTKVMTWLLVQGVEGVTSGNTPVLHTRKYGKAIQ